MAQINPLLRTLVRIMYGTALSPGTHADALASYQRATALAPHRLIHRVEAGKALLALGRREEAAAAFQVGLRGAAAGVACAGRGGTCSVEQRAVCAARG